MKTEKFDEFAETVTQSCLRLMRGKSDEYARDDDKLSNFKKTAAMKGETPEKALWGMVAKHIIATQDFINDLDKGVVRPICFWQEKIRDTINYHILLEALITERIENENL